MPIALLATSNPSSVSTITLSNIPQTYDHLKILYQLRFDTRASTSNLRLNFNGSSANQYKWLLVRGDGSTVSTTGSKNINEIQPGWLEGTNATANVFSNGEIMLHNYKSAVNKTIITDNVPENNNTSAFYSTFGVGIYMDTSAITSVTISSGDSFIGTIWLYGIS